jgi:hypothetical protein
MEAPSGNRILAKTHQATNEQQYFEAGRKFWQVKFNYLIYFAAIK